MKKVTLYTTAVLASLIVTGIATTASADEVATYDAYGAIKYTPSTNVTDPIDPLNPTQPVTPENPDPTIPVVPGTPGPLSIDFASSFDFGTQSHQKIWFIVQQHKSTKMLQVMQLLVQTMSK